MSISEPISRPLGLHKLTRIWIFLIFVNLGFWGLSLLEETSPVQVPKLSGQEFKCLTLTEYQRSPKRSSSLEVLVTFRVLVPTSSCKLFSNLEPDVLFLLLKFKSLEFDQKIPTYRVLRLSSPLRGPPQILS